MKDIRECLCDRANDNERSKTNEADRLRVGLEHICKVVNGKGSCGEDFYESDGSPCRWCCQIIKMG